MAANRNLLMLPGDGIGPEVMGEVKRALDPQNILNPGKMVQMN